jgi:hypothetical protein
MHSHDRTLIANLGFSDPDKRLAEHDYACQYLSLPEQRDRLIRLVANDTVNQRLLERNFPFNATALEGTFLKSSAEVEFLLTKGLGQYKTTIGFCDVLLSFEYTGAVPGREWVVTGRIIVEVKIAKVPIGDVMRQLGLYAGYFRDIHPHRNPLLALAAAYDVGDVECAALKAKGIHVVRLGEGFTEFLKSATQSKAPLKPVPVF